jgi:gliding motility-associated-like protein
VFFLCLQAIGQLTTVPGGSPVTIVQNTLLGAGVTVSNIMYNGSPSALGTFNASGTNLGITSGVVMTTGTVINNGAGPHGPNNQSNSGVDNSAGGSNLLSGLIGGIQTYNASILEFDFIPYSDTVRFKYVFGSEEYPEFAPPNNSSYNDVFGFFITGPGIPLPPQNIAKLPSGAIVSINNVNPVTNSSYYNANGDGSSAPQNGSPFYIQYDGFTDVLEAVSKVQCGQTYHLILAIADVGDGIFDSGIFLEANSLSSKVPVEITYELSEQAYVDPDLMAEGCVSTVVTLERGSNGASGALTIPVNVSGTATEGVDYTNIPATVTFAPGQTSISFSFDAFADGLTEGQETIILNFPITDPCGNVNPITINLGIADILPVSVTVQSGDVLCPGDDLELLAVANGGVGPYTYQWDTGATTSSIFVTPTSTQTYTVSVTDNCLNQTTTGSGVVNVPVYPPLTLVESTDITEICPYIPMQLEVVATGGAGMYTYQWSTGTQQLGNLSTQVVTPSITTSYSITVTDQCGIASNALVVYTITSPPLTLTMNPSVEICPGDSVLVSVTATGGYGQYYYEWSPTGETTAQIWASPMETTFYEVSVSDECQTFTVEGGTTITVVRPTANFEIASHTLFDDLPITFQNTTINGDTYQWYFGDGNTSTMVHPNNTYDEPGTYLITLIATDAKGCKDTISKPIAIQEAYYVYVPNTFTPDGLRHNNTFGASFYGIRTANVMIFNRWGQRIFTSNELSFEWDGTYKGTMVQDGTYTWKIKYLTNSGIEETITGHVNLMR